MAGISAAVLLFVSIAFPSGGRVVMEERNADYCVIQWVPLYIWGKKIRHATWHWPFMRYVHWEDDREVGE